MLWCEETKSATSLVSRKKQYADLQSEDVRFVQSRNVHFSGGPTLELSIVEV